MFDQRASNPGQIVGYSDFDHDVDRDERHSLTGFVFHLCGSCVSWRATLQHVVVLSSTEAEFMLVLEAAKEAIWIHGFLGDLGIEQVDRVVLSDSQSAIHLAKDEKFHERIKLSNFFIRHHVGEKTLYIEKIDTKDNPTDMLTKAVPKAKCEHCLDLVGIRACPS
jgi:hypothetical protein